MQEWFNKCGKTHHTYILRIENHMIISKVAEKGVIKDKQ